MEVCGENPIVPQKEEGRANSEQRQQMVIKWYVFHGIGLDDIGVVSALKVKKCFYGWQSEMACKFCRCKHASETTMVTLSEHHFLTQKLIGLCFLTVHIQLRMRDTMVWQKSAREIQSADLVPTVV